MIDYLEEPSNERKQKTFELEEQNIEEIKGLLKINSPIREKNKDIWTTNEFKLDKCTVYELINHDEPENPTFIITNIALKGLSWGDLIDIRAKKASFKTNVEKGVWITYYKNKIKYTVSYNKDVIACIQIEKNAYNVNISFYSNDKQVEKELIENAKTKVLLIDVLKDIDYNNSEINEMIDAVKNNLIYLDEKEIEKQLLIVEKEELQQSVKLLTLKVNRATEKINKISKDADIAEKKTKTTLEEISRIKRENEDLKVSISNVKKLIAKKCTYIPFVGRAIIRILNTEFGENALPSGK